MLLNWVQFEGEGITVVKSPPVDGTVGGTVRRDAVAVARRSRPRSARSPPGVAKRVHGQHRGDGHLDPRVTRP